MSISRQHKKSITHGEVARDSLFIQMIEGSIPPARKFYLSNSKKLVQEGDQWESNLNQPPHGGFGSKLAKTRNLKNVGVTSSGKIEKFLQLSKCKNLWSLARIEPASYMSNRLYMKKYEQENDIRSKIGICKKFHENQKL